MQKQQTLQMQKAKESIRKLPMFETYEDDDGEYDFEWPTKSQLKQVSQVKQLRIKEIRY